MKSIITLSFVLFTFSQMSMAQFSYSDNEKLARARDEVVVFTNSETGEKLKRSVTFVLELQSQNKLLWLPKISLFLSESNDVDSLSLSYSNASKRHVTKALHSTLQNEVDQAFPMISLGDHYTSPFWGFLRTQHFLALFIKNGAIDINLTIDGVPWTGSLGLRGSTTAYYRYVWYVVHPQIKAAGVYDPVPQYLTLCQDKKTPCGKGSRSNRTTYAYGMSEHGAVDIDLPKHWTSESLISLDPENYQDSLTDAEAVYEHYLSKTKLVDAVDKVTDTKDFIKNNAKLVTLFDEIRYKWSHGIEPIVGQNSEVGYLQKLKQREMELTKNLSRLEVTIDELTNSKVNPMLKEVKASDLEFAEHGRVLADYELEISTLAKHLRQLEADLAEFTELLEVYKQWLRQNRKKRISHEGPLLDGVQVRAIHQSQLMRHQRLEKITQLKKQLQLALRDIHSLVRGAAAAVAASEKTLAFYSKRSQLLGDIATLQLKIEQQEKKFPQTLRERYSEILQRTDEEITDLMLDGAGQRIPENEITAIRLLIRQHYDQMDAWLAEYAPSLNRIVCSSAHYKPYKEKFKGVTHCLSPYDLSDDPEKMVFYETLSPQEVDVILANFIDEPLNPWKGELSKLELLAQFGAQAVEDAQSILINPFGGETLGEVLVKEWESIQFLRWQLRVAKALRKQAPQQAINEPMYVTAAQQFEDHLNKQLMAPLDKMKTQLRHLDQRKTALLAESERLRGSYEIAAQEFVNQFITPIHTELDRVNQLGELPVVGTIESCHFPIADLDQCDGVLQQLQASASDVEITEQTNDLQTTFVMVESLKSLVFELEASISQTTKQHSLIISGKNQYRQKNDIDRLEQERDQLMAQLASAQTRLSEAQKNHLQTETNIRASQLGQFYQADRLSDFVYSIDLLKEKARPLLTAVQPTCTEVLPKLAEIKKHEEAILSIINGQTVTLEASTIAPSCSLPPLSQFQVVVP